MKTTLRIAGLALIVATTAALSCASLSTLAMIGTGCLAGLAFTGFSLCVLAGQITRADLDEANGETVDPNRNPYLD